MWTNINVQIWAMHFLAVESPQCDSNLPPSLDLCSRILRHILLKVGQAI